MDDEKGVKRNVTIDGDEIGSLEACSVIGLFNWFWLKMRMSFVCFVFNFFNFLFKKVLRSVTLNLVRLKVYTSLH